MMTDGSDDRSGAAFDADEKAFRKAIAGAGQARRSKSVLPVDLAAEAPKREVIMDS